MLPGLSSCAAASAMQAHAAGRPAASACKNTSFIPYMPRIGFANALLVRISCRARFLFRMLPGCAAGRFFLLAVQGLNAFIK